MGQYSAGPGARVERRESARSLGWRSGGCAPAAPLLHEDEEGAGSVGDADQLRVRPAGALEMDAIDVVLAQHHGLDAPAPGDRQRELDRLLLGIARARPPDRRCPRLAEVGLAHDASTTVMAVRLWLASRRTTPPGTTSRGAGKR